MEDKKVLNISIEKVVCTNKEGEIALPGLQSGEAFVRVELRGGASQKVSTPSTKLKKDTLNFDAKVTLELTDDASELRLLLCKKKDGVATQNTVLSAAGIYVKDILKAAPIVKYFDLFKSVSFLSCLSGVSPPRTQRALTCVMILSSLLPSSRQYGAGFGGKVKLSMTVSEGNGDTESKKVEASAKAPAAAPAPEAPVLSKKAKKGAAAFPLKLILLAAAGGAIAIVKGMKK
ncbi:hypothetical protein A3770_01p08630 [Chloropicon primus]|uniref:Uncharacterized protein n=1 Tax=Chloropicon primus TaxID=1764295 RepID=A0A5B8MF73_9CHLO|nr:hypothetical protein A3770_01p08630 [Chloropicon primus]|eukprot:QDZ18345.1 hypothetical protein A3770_01p08630 [Chloropicon primus]